MGTNQNNYVSIEKRSKKEQRKHHVSKRGSWNGVVPTTRIIESGKRYIRTKAKAATRKEREQTCD